MTRDLVKRLRAYQVGAHDGPPLHPPICDETADEIERLLKIEEQYEAVQSAAEDHRLD